nr:MAG TPA_asm: hypothetical protein [Caudoviricetes sp.]
MNFLSLFLQVCECLFIDLQISIEIYFFMFNNIKRY